MNYWWLFSDPKQNPDFDPDRMKINDLQKYFTHIGGTKKPRQIYELFTKTEVGDIAILYRTESDKYGEKLAKYISGIGIITNVNVEKNGIKNKNDTIEFIKVIDLPLRKKVWLQEVQKELELFNLPQIEFPSGYGPLTIIKINEEVYKIIIKLIRDKI